MAAEEEREKRNRKGRSAVLHANPKLTPTGRASGWVGDSETEMTLVGESVVRGEER